MRPDCALARRVVADARTRTLIFAAFFFATSLANAAGYRSTYPTLPIGSASCSGFADNKAARMFYGTPTTC